MDIMSCKMPDVQKEKEFERYPELARLLQQCWEKDPARRPNAKECLEVLDLMISTQNIRDMST